MQSLLQRRFLCTCIPRFRHSRLHHQRKASTYRHNNALCGRTGFSVLAEPSRLTRPETATENCHLSHARKSSCNQNTFSSQSFFESNQGGQLSLQTNTTDALLDITSKTSATDSARPTILQNTNPPIPSVRVLQGYDSPRSNGSSCFYFNRGRHHFNPQRLYESQPCFWRRETVRNLHHTAHRAVRVSSQSWAPNTSSGSGSSTTNNNSSQFFNPTRNIFGQADGDPYFDLHDIDYHLFDYLSDEQGKLAISKFLQALRATGLKETDPRLKESMRNLHNVQHEVSDIDAVQQVFIDRETFRECIADNIILIAKAFRHQFIIPEFTKFTNRIDEMFWRAKANTRGKLASYIPQLARFNPESWGVAVCTVDGQRYSLGDALDPICLQSMSKPLTYAMVLDELGPEVVHQYVGQEPSGQAFNMISLDHKNRPHNPMVNAGAVAVCALLKQGLNIADKFDYTQQRLKQLCGNEYVSFNNSVFLSERQTADRNYAIAYYMKENQCFPKGTNLHELMDFYFQLCSIEMNCESGAVVAATLANGGICPITGIKVLEPYCIRDTLSLMLSCGMYDYSGQFAFKVGLPGKSGVSGGILLVVPNVMGIFMWSPPLDHYGNSVRGIQFCEDLVRNFNFHNYDNLRHTPRKTDPRVQTVDHQANLVVNLIFAAYNGDVTAIRRCALLGMDMSHADYDGRTALHVASAEGHNTVVEFLLDKCNCSPFLVDRWGFTPIDDAKRFQHNHTVELLERYMAKEKEAGKTAASIFSDDILH